MKRSWFGFAFALVLAAAAPRPDLAPSLSAQTATCNLSGYKAGPGLTAAVAGGTLTLTWDGDANQEVRMQLAIVSGTPTIEDLAVRRKGGVWASVVTNATPEFRVVSGFRRATDQQIKPLQELGIAITPEVIDRIKWEAFWDAPLNIPGDEVAHGGSTPPLAGIANQPGLPRKPDEVKRASAVFQAQACEVKRTGERIDVSFPGVKLGVFDGRLEYTIYKGTNLIRQAIVAKTEERSVAYKYDAGLKGLAIQPASRVVWRDTSNLWQENRLGGTKNDGPVTLKASNRLVVAEGSVGSIAAFPPPHRFFWARETEFNLGYNWYRKDSASTFAFGIRQAEKEEAPHAVGRGPEDTSQNFALYSARPGTWQQMPVFLYVSAEPGQAALQSALAFTREDRYKPLPGYQVMATHFHTSVVQRLREMGSLDAKLPDFEAVRAAGINIFAPIDGGGGGGRGGGDPLKVRADYYEVARRHSDKNFMVMPNEEVFTGILGGHIDMIESKPLFWLPSRKAGEPLVEKHPTYGTVYHVGSPADMMEMAKLENVLIFMPHPRSKGSTGFPEAVKDTDHFKNAYYRGIGLRWGMGVDGSEMRLCEYRCQALLDEMNNWVADLPTPLKYMQAISETYRKGPGDDIYANNPVNYVKLDTLPGPDDRSSVVNAMKRGDYFWTSGEVLIPSYAVQGSGARRTIAVDLEWTFPLDFVEVVWGDGVKTERQIIQAADLPAFGQHHYQIPFDATGKKWVRFAAWDIAGNGAMVQPIKLTGAAPTTAGGR
jgi:hypothetical protein